MGEYPPKADAFHVEASGLETHDPGGKRLALADDQTRGCQVVSRMKFWYGSTLGNGGETVS